MTRRERLERKVEKREEWAEKRDVEGHNGYERANEAAKPFENGQPILIGHHSEKMMRAAQKRVDTNMRACIENHNMAEHHRDKAVGLQNQLDHSIFSDDPDAVERLEEKISEMESRQAFMTAVNKICRNKKRDDAEKMEQIVAMGAREEDAKTILHPEYHWQSVGFESFELSNNNANIRRCKDRLATIKASKALQDRAETASNGVIIDRIYGGKMARITFSEKPDREILNELKAVGFRWSKVCWVGDADKIPLSVSKMAK